MMVNDIREYRGKSVNDNRWLYGSLVVTEEYGNWIYDAYMSREEPDMNTVGQWTGLRDKNKQKIYEGQLVFDEDDKYLVVWINEDACYQLNLYGPGMYHNEGGGEEWTNDDRDLGYAGIDMDVVSVMEIVKETDDK